MRTDTHLASISSIARHVYDPDPNCIRRRGFGSRAPLTCRAVAFLAAIAAGMLLASVASASARGTLYVSATGTDSGNCQKPDRACASIGYALSQASPGSRVLVGPGTYPESANPGGGANLITPGLTGVTLTSNRAWGASAANTVIDATGQRTGILDQANNTTVSGFTVEHAQLEGILVEPPPSSWPASPTASPANLSHVTVEDNVVEHNDLAYDTTAPNPMAACPTSPTDGDDCGEGIHLLATTYSRVTGNQVANNVGGILLSDGGLPTATGGPTSVGPAAHNVIAFNASTDNAFDCGITLPSHDPRAVSTQGQPQPSLAGVYDNLVVGNVSKTNGGAGLLDATPYPGTGAYDNTFMWNRVAGNGEGGFQLHSHAPQQDVNGNRVVGNSFGTNNIAGDPDSGDRSTTAIILFSAVVPVTNTVVVGNVINGDTDGIWKTANVTARGLELNVFLNVGTDVFTQ
jgi:parallel beta-helix repeat protein